MACISMPLGVSSMFSITETNLAPAARMAIVIVTSSIRLRANRSTLCTSTRSTGSERSATNIRCKSGRSADLADSPASTNSPTTTAPNSWALR
ncbi:hypothetical protein BJP25_05635 [Actinokineospora bangkokensis]|uniref:Uncharacterized protein n=1 Tax=Actinokineospora bangkokensis TaxID=1193682 RepID=A0A1Q9LC03_9PSEU|nr:hypothetical protein [Actinokineospora bangkokensis]OLR89558.1 hypothetical protein BJP25_05635 [Actinokineospora bangkokensis]